MSQDHDSADKLPPAWTTADVKAYLNISGETLYKLIASKALPYGRVGREYRFDPEVVRAFLRGENVAAVAARRPRPGVAAPWMQGVRRVVRR